MRKAPATIVILALLTPVLGGCQSFIGRALGLSKDKSEEQQAAKETDYAEAQMALGRAGLDSGEFGQAIVAFRNARTYPEHSAGATNGLAVAYLQLGRPDLAERFFKEAIALDPGNRKYQANLNRFYEAVPQVAVKATREEAPALAGLTMQPQIAAPQAAPQAMANVSQISSVSFEQTTGRMQRVSASEVVIGAAPAAIAAAPGERRRAATAAAAPAAVVQDRRRRNPAYPVRVGIAAAPVAKAAAYPVRLGLAAKPATITVTRSDGTLVSSGPVKRR